MLVIFPYDILHGLSFFGFQLTTNKYHELGDFVGGITAPVLSIVAIILLYMTYSSQKKELAASRNILTKQSQTLNKQQFEITFFNMLNLHHEIVGSIDLVEIPKMSIDRTIKTALGEMDAPKNIISGRDCFKVFYSEYEDDYNYQLKCTKKVSSEDIDYKELMKISYSIFYKKHESDLGHYFRNLYHIFKFIKKSEIEDKKDYVSLVRAQLSSYELLLLFYNGLSIHGMKFKPLIEDFHILKNMPVDDLISVEHRKKYKDYYKKSAFENMEN